MCLVVGQVFMVLAYFVQANCEAHLSPFALTEGLHQTDSHQTFCHFI